MGALEAVKKNFDFSASSLKLFETGTAFAVDEKGKISESREILITIAGENDISAFDQKSRYFDVLDLKGEVQVLLEKLNIANYNINYYNYSETIESAIEFSYRSDVFLKILKFSESYLKTFDIERPVIACSVAINKLFRLTGQKTQFKAYSNFPMVLRDLSIVVDREIKEGDIEEVIISSAPQSLLRSLKLYDRYEFDKSAGSKISYTYALAFQSDEKTLTGDEVNSVQDKIVKNLGRKLNAELRK
jgi:phenylalanyl-tRNA synthetase beta chain